MRNIFAAFILLFILVVPGMANASSYYLTLSGTVGSVEDGGGLVSAAGISIGDTLSYVVKIDTDQTGSVTASWGTQDKYGTIYSSLYSGVLSGMNTQSDNYLQTYWEGFYSRTSGDDSTIEFQNWTSDLASLTVGSSISTLNEFAYNSNYGFSKVVLDGVTVTSISETAPTPIPGAGLMMLGGLGVVGFVRRRFSS
ncbi:VPLPA-CTERM sorting domain-containing protein [Maridesulfovibrio sp.]|uniref:VPLPA-CTERM sorting domain-containing protein n=1 Tax=Maridesulfovibrio sp. TaxID=2795000 RepID=UPI002A18945B|nr:VPLPA-CTERM sorting domain-containing protein [Maridesulfovibrio sp.]